MTTKSKDYKALWYQKNRDRVLARVKAHYYANREEIIAKKAFIRVYFREQNKEVCRKWKLVNYPCILGCGRGTVSLSGVCEPCRKTVCTRCNKAFTPLHWKQTRHKRCTLNSKDL